MQLSTWHLKNNHICNKTRIKFEKFAPHKMYCHHLQACWRNQIIVWRCDVAKCISGDRTKFETSYCPWHASSVAIRHAFCCKGAWIRIGKDERTNNTALQFLGIINISKTERIEGSCWKIGATNFLLIINFGRSFPQKPTLSLEKKCHKISTKLFSEYPNALHNVPGNFSAELTFSKTTFYKCLRRFVFTVQRDESICRLS